MSLFGCNNKSENAKIDRVKYPIIPQSIELPQSKTNYHFYASQNGYFYKNDGKPIYINGVNIGLTTATTNLDNPNVSYDTYMKWFSQIGQMNANTVRAFTVMNPNFYNALYDYNYNNPDNLLYLIQGIWFPENLMYELKDALEKLKLNDDSIVFEPETSQALGFGFRCGFLGLLHMDVTQERVEREYNIPLIATAPSVIYHVYLHDGSMLEIDNPSKLPDLTKIDRIEEPIVRTTIMTPNDYVGPLMELCQKKRGVYIDFRFPLEVVRFDRLSCQDLFIILQVSCKKFRCI